MAAPGPPPSWSPRGAPYPGGPPFPGPPAPGGPLPPAGRAKPSGPPVALIIIVAVVFLTIAGGGAYVATISNGAYPNIMWACTLVPPSDVASLVPQGLPDIKPPVSGATNSDCAWDNLAAANAGTQKQIVHMQVSVSHFERHRLSSAEKEAHKWLRFQAAGANISAPGSPISGYGDEAFRMPKSFGDDFDEIIFRESNLFVDVGVGVEVMGNDLKLSGQAWSRTERAATLVQQRLRMLRH